MVPLCDSWLRSSSRRSNGVAHYLRALWLGILGRRRMVEEGEVAIGACEADLGDVASFRAGIMRIAVKGVPSAEDVEKTCHRGTL